MYCLPVVASVTAQSGKLRQVVVSSPEVDALVLRATEDVLSVVAVTASVSYTSRHTQQTAVDLTDKPERSPDLAAAIAVTFVFTCQGQISEVVESQPRVVRSN